MMILYSVNSLISILLHISKWDVHVLAVLESRSHANHTKIFHASHILRKRFNTLKVDKAFLLPLTLRSCSLEICRHSSSRACVKDAQRYISIQPTSTFRPLHVDSSPEAGTSIDSRLSEFLLDTEDLVELSQTLRSGRGAGFLFGSISVPLVDLGTTYNLTRTKTDNNVSDGNIFSFARPVRNHDTPASTKSVFSGLDSLADGTDLVDLEEKCVAGLKLNGLLNESRVGNSQVITTTPCQPR